MSQVKVTTHNLPQKAEKKVKHARTRLVVQNHTALAKVTNASVKHS